ncbi:FAD-binding protein [candidate division WOR-3 bacterium]|nr:FAD-binding protein [candidate division WOR-3 bacterium]
MFDIVVIGGGPSGAAFAWLASKHFKVLILEKRELQAHVPKSVTDEKNCGGLLAPDAQRMLAKFGLGLPLEVLVEPQLFSVRAIDLLSKVERHYQRHYINIDRYKFDRWFLNLAREKAEVEYGAYYVSHSESKHGFEVLYRKNGEEKKVRVKILVGADGAFSRVRARVFPSKKIRTYLSFQQWFRTANFAPYFCSVFDPRVTDFYSWVIPKGDMLILGSAFTKNDDIHGKMRFLKENLSNSGIEFGKMIYEKGCFLLRPSGLNELVFSKGRTALIGEAGGFISPSSAEGLSYALWSALNLFKSLGKDPDNFSAAYARQSAGIFLNITGKLMKSPFLFNTNLRNAIMKSNLNSVNVIYEK